MPCPSLFDETLSISMTGPGFFGSDPLEPDGIFLWLAAYPVTREHLLGPTCGKPTTVLQLTTTSPLSSQFLSAQFFIYNSLTTAARITERFLERRRHSRSRTTTVWYCKVCGRKTLESEAWGSSQAPYPTAFWYTVAVSFDGLSRFLQFYLSQFFGLQLHLPSISRRPQERSRKSSSPDETGLC